MSVQAHAADAPSAWAAAEAKEAIALGFVPPTLQSDYQANLTRSEFADMIICFLASQYGYDTTDAGLSLFREACMNKHANPNGDHFVKSNFVDESDKNTSYSWDFLLYNNVNVFSDLSDESLNYYTKMNINMAYLLGIVRGQGNGIYNPSGFVTRQGIAVMLQRAYATYGEVTQAPETAISFSDHAAIAEWAQESVDFMASWNIMKGNGANSFEPCGFCTREQGILILLRLYQNMPTSRSNGTIPSLLSYNELVDSLTQEVSNAHLEYSCETDICGIYYVTYGGTMGNYPPARLFLVYPSCTYVEVSLPTPIITDLRLNEPETQLLFHSSDGTVYSVSLETGTVISN